MTSTRVGILLLILAAAPVGSQPPEMGVTDSTHSTDSTAWTHPLPLGAEWALERGIPLPLPFGIGATYVFMSRDIEVTDVRVKIGDRPPESISDFASFAVRNKTSVGALRLDAWVLPFLDLYLMAGYTWTNSNLLAKFTFDPVFPPGPPITVDVDQASKVSGPYFGGGATLVAGYRQWFVLFDGNYGRTSLDEFEGSIDFWFAALRTGWSGKGRGFGWRAWLGAMYLMAERTLTAVVDNQLLGPIEVAIDQRPANPWTAQLGGGLQVGRRWEVLLEVGSNFEDATIVVVSAAFRF
jgi:hypothetical protein